MQKYSELNGLAREEINTVEFTENGGWDFVLSIIFCRMREFDIQ